MITVYCEDDDDDHERTTIFVPASTVHWITISANLRKRFENVGETRVMSSSGRTILFPRTWLKVVYFTSAIVHLKNFGKKSLYVKQFVEDFPNGLHALHSLIKQLYHHYLNK